MLTRCLCSSPMVAAVLFITLPSKTSLDTKIHTASISTAIGPQTEAPETVFYIMILHSVIGRGTCSDGARRGPIRIICPDGAPCYNIVLENVDMWTETSSVEYCKCESAYGTDICLEGGSSYNSYAVVTKTISSAP